MKALILGKAGPKVTNLNRRKAIRHRCLNCSGYSPKDVTCCDRVECSLYPFRTGNGKQNPKARSKAIRNYCLWCMAGQRSEVKKCVSPDCAIFSYRNVVTDRTAETKLSSKMGHIEGISEDKIEKAYITIG